MTQLQEHHDDKKVRDGYASRSLDKSYPALKDYLKEGDVVLDMGCGPGTITMGVAEFVKPGRVVGVDIAEGAIADAREKAKEAKLENIEFLVANAADLQLEVDTFDFCYEHAVLKWLRDPRAVLTEMHRVTKPSGTVVVSVGWGQHFMYPRCPNVEKIFKAWDHWGDPTSEYFVWNNRIEEEIFDLLKEVGFSEIDVRMEAATAHRIGGLKVFLLNEEGGLKEGYQHLYQLGVLEPETMERARNELDAWHEEIVRFYGDASLMFVCKV